MITEEESEWPEERTLEVFLNWFTIDIGSTVFDLEKADLKGEKL